MTMNLRTEFKRWQPLPALSSAVSQRERENCPPLARIANPSSDLPAARSEDQSLTETRLTTESSKATAGCPLSPGERVRVRASVKPTPRVNSQRP